MHADRKRVFVDTLRWDLPVVDAQFEIDEYDTEDAIYLIVAAPGDGRHLGSVRIVPTSGPHLLADKFAFLCAGPVPRGARARARRRVLIRPCRFPLLRRSIC